MRAIIKRGRAYAQEIVSAYGRHAGSQLSAAIAYRVLFSLVPFAAFLLTILDTVLPASRREQFVQWLFGVFPGADLEQSIIRDRESGPTYVRSKLRDFALVGVAGALVVAAFGLSVIVRIVVQTGSDLSDALGFTNGASAVSTLVEIMSSTLVIFNTIYGPIGAVLVFLLLVYLLAAIVLLGAETAAARSRSSV